MSEIKRGDLVMVVKPSECCGSNRSLGQLFTVNKIVVEAAKCTSCGQILNRVTRAEDASDNTITEVTRLKKIDPPATGEYDGVAVRKTQPKEVTV